MDGCRLVRPGILAGLLLSAVAFLLAPLLMPSSYSWIAHTLSQAASQGLQGGWLARLGFLIGGLTMMRLARPDVIDWLPAPRLLHRIAGVMTLAAVVFSDRSWDSNAPYDPFENIIHSAVATTISISFTLGVLLVLKQKRQQHDRVPLMESAVIAIEIIFPLLMLVWPGWTGIIERLMITAAYVWYGIEVLRCGGLAMPLPDVTESWGGSSNSSPSMCGGGTIRTNTCPDPKR